MLNENTVKIMARLVGKALQKRSRKVYTDAITAAYAHVTEHGITAYSMSDLGAQAKVSRSGMYRYFDNMEDVLTVVAACIKLDEPQAEGNKQIFCAYVEQFHSERLQAVLEIAQIEKQRQKFQVKILPA